jgi:hypothetical protein
VRKGVKQAEDSIVGCFRVLLAFNRSTNHCRAHSFSSSRMRSSAMSSAGVAAVNPPDHPGTHIAGGLKQTEQTSTILYVERGE